MITVSCQEQPTRGFGRIDSYSFGKAPNGKTYYLCLMVPLSFDGSSAGEPYYRFDKQEIGTIAPSKRKERFGFKREELPGTVYNVIRQPNGRPLHGVYHASLDGSIVCKGEIITMEKITLSWEGITVQAYKDPHEGYSTISCYIDYSESLHKEIINKIYSRNNASVQDYRHTVEVEGRRTVHRILYSLNYKYYWWAPYTIYSKMAEYFDDGGQFYAYSAGQPYGSDSTVIGTFDWSYEERMCTQYLTEYHPNYQAPTGDPIYRITGGEPPPREYFLELFKKVLEEIAIRDDSPNAVLSHLSEQWSDSCLQAVDNARFVKVNMIEFWKDVGETFAEVGAIQKLIDAGIELTEAGLKKLIKKLRKMTKESANTYLAVHYGTRLTMSDLEKITNGGAKFIWTYYSEHRKDARNLKGSNIVTYSLPEGSIGEEAALRTNYTLCYNPYQGISEFGEVMHELGYSPSMHQIWEAIPLSFTVDWFVNVTDILKAQDHTNYMAKLQVNYEVKSYRLTSDISRYMSETTGLDCNIGYTLYSRFVADRPTVTPAAITVAGEPQKHWLEGGSLLVSRLL